MKFPYGISNFAELRTEGYFYVDKTRYIEQLESAPEKYPVLLRSRRFGKTLFCNMLGYYYDRQYADRFEEIFKGTYIYDHPTPKRHAYMMLAFNFSGINTQTLENANEGFAVEVRTSVRAFTGRYKEFFSPDERRRIVAQEKPNNILNELFKTFLEKGVRKDLYVIIDEYDHFANNLLSQGKEMFHDLVKTDGYIRPFYEALKKGTETVIDRIFITGVLPILLDSLTSGFNIAKNKSLEKTFNEILGFTQEEISPILAYLGHEACAEDIRTYYNGYRFSPYSETSVYNSDMVLYYALEYDPALQRPATMIDPNVVSDYRKIRAVLAIGTPELEEAVLTQIVKENNVELAEITPLFVLTRDTELLFTQASLASLLFYMGYLTLADRQGLSLILRMPNLVMKSLYLDYMEYLLMKRGQVRVDSLEKLKMLQALVDGSLDEFVTLTEKLLKGLSNRDYERFDEKYIKVVMLSLLSDVNVYIPHSEYEVSAAGYVDLYLQAAFEPERSAHYFIELKYAKARASKHTLDSKERDGRAAMTRYLASERAKGIKHLHAYLLIFRKDVCVRKIRC